MKKQLLTIIFAAVSFAAISQPCLQKCVGDGGGFTAQNLATNAPFDATTHNIVWSSTVPNAFVGQGTNQITWAVISNAAGNFNGSYTVTNIASNCDTTINFCIDVIAPTPPVATNETYCFGTPLVIPLTEDAI